MKHALVSKLQQEIALNREFASSDEITFLALAHTWQRLEKLGQTFFAKHGLSSVQFNVLMILWDYRKTPIRQHRLAEILVVNRASSGGVIDRMEQRGWVERRPDPEDRRGKYVHLTAQGQRLLEDVKKAYYPLISQLFGGFQARSKNQFPGLAGSAPRTDSA